MKKILCLLVIIGSLVGVTGCSKGNTSSEATNKLVVWSFTDELEKIINNNLIFIFGISLQQQ